MKNIKNTLKFVCLSSLGIFLFMFPISYFDSTLNELRFTIPIALLIEVSQNLFAEYLDLFVLIAVSISAIMPLIFKKYTTNNKLINSLSKINNWWIFIRIIGAIFVWMCYFNAGFSYVISPDNGVFIFRSLLTTLFVLFVFAGFLLPLLLNYGLLEFIGTLVTKFMRPIFSLPGRAAIDCITSWLGDGTLGVMLTAKQYEQGYYSEKEASIIATTFSAVSITFCLVVLKQVNLQHLFLPYYLLICFIGLVCAFIIPKLPPLSRKKGVYLIEGNSDESIPKNETSLKWAFKKALLKAEQEKGLCYYLKNALVNILEMWISILPVVMALGTIALIISNETSFFTIIGKPLVPFLKLLQISEAETASKTILVGFTDMFIPSIIAGNEIKSELTRFVVATVSVTQLIYMSEVGALIMASKIPVKLKELFLIFLERTVISLIIVSFVARYILALR